VEIIYLLLTFLLDEKSYKRIKENLKARRWSFVAWSGAIRATTIPSVIAQEAAPPNFPFTARFFIGKNETDKSSTQKELHLHINI